MWPRGTMAVNINALASMFSCCSTFPRWRQLQIVYSLKRLQPTGKCQIKILQALLILYFYSKTLLVSPEPGSYLFFEIHENVSEKILDKQRFLVCEMNVFNGQLIFNLNSKLRYLTFMKFTMWSIIDILYFIYYEKTTFIIVLSKIPETGYIYL